MKNRTKNRHRKPRLVSDEFLRARVDVHLGNLFDAIYAQSSFAALEPPARSKQVISRVIEPTATPAAEEKPKQLEGGG